VPPPRTTAFSSSVSFWRGAATAVTPMICSPPPAFQPCFAWSEPCWQAPPWRDSRPRGARRRSARTASPLRRRERTARGTARALLSLSEDRLGIRHPIAEPQPKEPHEREPVADLELDGIIRQAVERLQHQDLEHQRRIIGGLPRGCDRSGPAPRPEPAGTARNQRRHSDDRADRPPPKAPPAAPRSGS
jgi:hypothetical protein